MLIFSAAPGIGLLWSASLSPEKQFNHILDSTQLFGTFQQHFNVYISFVCAVICPVCQPCARTSATTLTDPLNKIAA
jgi:hypothetical protein